MFRKQHLFGDRISIVKNLPSNTWTILLAVIALAALTLLAASLSTLRFAEGKPLPVNNLAPNLTQSGDSSDLMRHFLVVFRVMMIFMWILLPFYIIYLIISKEARKKLLRDIALFLPILVLLYFLSNSLSGQKAAQDLAGKFGMDTPKEGESQKEASPLPEFQPPPPWVTTVASLILATATVILVFAIVWIIWRRARRKEDEPLRRIEIQAREAIDSLEAGGDLREVILRCYMQMIIALRDYRLINREQNMTPHEFEQLLERRGLPNEPVRQLTELFERVRYGAHSPGRQEESVAIASLSAIVSACQRSAFRVRS